jgi:replicative superfamily II helicase
LAAGVNLPAHRVIISEPRMGIHNLSVSAFRQMCGRAGRMGLDSDGEAILMLSNRETSLGEMLVSADLDPLKSSLYEAEGGGIEKLLLEMICCEKLAHPQDVGEFMRCTLFFVQRPAEEVRFISYHIISHHSFCYCIYLHLIK